MPPQVSAPLPTIALIGAPGTGAAALTRELQQRVAADAARFVCTTAAEDCTGAALTLLMGLDLPCPPAQQPDRDAADARLRAALARAGLRYQVVYGQGERRIGNALNAIKNIATGAYPSSATGTFESNIGTRTARLRDWNCEKCSDPQCEHRLFTSLVAQREARQA